MSYTFLYYFFFGCGCF